jgi:hypothetical protein
MQTEPHFDRDRSMIPTLHFRRSKLDLAILASLAAMAAMNMFVLAQQLQPAATLAAARIGALQA